ncbi:hypothetical protein MMC27_004117 [Xylographa pallens]|nr:hypothetical protein [Xylographa pallens]
MAFYSGISPERRREVYSYLTTLGAPAGFARLFETPEPLEDPITTAECLAAASLIPDSLPLDTNNPGDPARLNLLYSNTQRQSIIQYRLDTGFVAGNCLVQILRRPSYNPGLRYADASAMALIVYPNVRQKALALIHQCLSGDGGRQQYRFGHVGTVSVLSGHNFYYVVQVTLWPDEGSVYQSEHFYSREGEIQLEVLNDVGPAGWGTGFPFVDAFN